VDCNEPKVKFVHRSNHIEYSGDEKNDVNTSRYKTVCVGRTERMIVVFFFKLGGAIIIALQNFLVTVTAKWETCQIFK